MGTAAARLRQRRVSVYCGALVREGAKSDAGGFRSGLRLLVLLNNSYVPENPRVILLAPHPWDSSLAYQHAISAGMCPELIFPYIPYLLTYPSGSSPALSSRRKNTGVNLK